MTTVAKHARVKTVGRHARVNETVSLRQVSWPSVVFWGLLIVGVTARILWLFTNGMNLTSDHGVVYLMALGVGDGHFPLVFWGQAYGGSVLPITAGLLMGVFGDHVEILGIVGVLFFAGTAVLVRIIASRTINRAAGNIAGVAVWFPGYPLFYLSVSDPGFYGPSILFALGAVALSVRPLLPRRRYLLWLFVGLLCGLALWQSPMGGALAVPALLVLLIRDRSWRIVIGLAGAIIGASPWLLHFVVERGSAGSIGARTIFYPQSMVTFFTQLLSAALDAGQSSFSRLAVAGVVVALLGLLAVLAVIRRNLGLGALFLGAVLCYFAVISGAGTILNGNSYRYAIFILPALAVALAWIITRLKWLAGAALFLLPALSVAPFLTHPPSLAFNSTDRYGVGIPALAEKLDSMGVDAVFADYWASYALTADTDGEITADPLLISRYPPYRTAALDTHPTVLVVFEGAPNDTALRTNPSIPQFVRTTAGGYAIYSFDQPFNPTAGFSWDLF